MQAVHTEQFRSWVVPGRTENHWSKSPSVSGTRADSSLPEFGMAIQGCSWWVEGRQDTCLKPHPDGEKDKRKDSAGFGQVVKTESCLGVGSRLGFGPGGVLSQDVERTNCTTLGPFCIAGTVQSSLLT